MSVLVNLDCKNKTITLSEKGEEAFSITLPKGFNENTALLHLKLLYNGTIKKDEFGKVYIIDGKYNLVTDNVNKVAENFKLTCFSVLQQEEGFKINNNVVGGGTHKFLVSVSDGYLTKELEQYMWTSDKCFKCSTPVAFEGYGYLMQCDPLEYVITPSSKYEDVDFKEFLKRSLEIKITDNVSILYKLETNTFSVIVPQKHLVHPNEFENLESMTLYGVTGDKYLIRASKEDLLNLYHVVEHYLRISHV